MKINDYSHKKSFQVIATQARRVDIPANRLCQIHTEMGRMLGYEMIEHLQLEEIEIQHVQGIRKGVAIRNENQFSILVLMRAGWFTAQGIREVFPNASLILLNENWKKDFANYNLKNKTPIIVDSVINTGTTMNSILDYLPQTGCNPGFIATLILQRKAIQHLSKHKNYSLFAFRISDNKYTGTGGTDTGNRLFNTI